MKTLLSLITRVSADSTRHPAFSLRRVRRDPLCEALEGRRLLSTAASTVASGHDMGFDRHAALGASAGAEISHFGSHGGDVGHGGGLAQLAHSHAAGALTGKP
jgi:hypothetical protein